MATLLILEDDIDTNEAVCEYLQEAGHSTISAFDGDEAITLFSENKIDLVVLDIMLPTITGLAVLNSIRKTSQVPVLMLTAMEDEQTQVASFDGQADDYMTKPFAIEELLARIRLVLKKRGGAPSADKNQLGIGKLCMDVQRYEVSYDGQQVELTHREFELLRVLLENKNIVISRDTLLEKVCGYDYMGETNIIDVYVRYLRSKIDDVYQVKIIQTVRGVGYCIKDE